MSEKSTIKINETVSRKAFIGFVVAVIFFMITNIDTMNGDWAITGWFGLPICVWNYMWKILLYTIGTAIIMLLGINNPGVKRLIIEIEAALADGKFSPEERLHIIMIAKDEFLGAWADLSAQLAKRNESLAQELPKKIDE